MNQPRFQAVAEKYLNVVLQSPSEWMAQCPLCDGEASLQFNIERGLWVCFRCGQGGSAKRLVKMIGGTYSDPYVSVEILQSALDHLRASTKQKPIRVMEESYLERFCGDSPNEYWKQRGFNNSVMDKWNLGYDPLTDRCTIAYRNVSGALLGVIQRRLDNEFPRYLYPKGFDRSGSLFGSWEAHGNKTQAILVEGSTDCIAVDSKVRGYGIPFAQYGSSISRRQIKLLRRLGVRTVTLFYDYDEAGRKAEQQALEVLEGFLVYIVNWDDKKYCWHKKVCNCGQHDWKTIAQCQMKKMCLCGRQHDMDPGKLPATEITKMLSNFSIAGKRQSAWDIQQSAKSKNARRKHMGG